MSICSCLLIDRSSKIKCIYNSCWSKVEYLINSLYYLFITVLSCSKSINSYRYRLCNTDSIADLNFCLISYSCCYNILSNPSSCICCRTVNLCWILS